MTDGETAILKELMGIKELLKGMYSHPLEADSKIATAEAKLIK